MTSSTELVRRGEVVVKGRLLSTRRELLLFTDSLKIAELKSNKNKRNNSGDDDERTGADKPATTEAKAKVKHTMDLSQIRVNELDSFGVDCDTEVLLTVAESSTCSKDFHLSFETNSLRQQWIEVILFAIYQAWLQRFTSADQAEQQLGLGWMHQIHCGTLHSACFLGDIVLAKKIIGRLPTCLDRLDDRGRTALHLACIKDHKKIIELLALEGADPSIVDACQNSPIHISASQGHSNTVRFLLGYCEIDDFPARVRSGEQSPVWMAALSCRPRAAECVDALARFGFEVDIRSGISGDPLFHQACEHAKESIVSTIIQHRKSPIDERDSHGFSALHRAVSCSSPSEAIVSTLLWKGAQPNAVVRDSDQSCSRPLHLTTDKSVAIALVSHGARIDLEDCKGRRGVYSFNQAFIEGQLRSAIVKFQRRTNVESCFSEIINMDEWTPDFDSLTCEACGTPFSFFVWRHHCRRCGLLVCDACSTRRMVLPLEDNRQERICDSCFNVLVDHVAEARMERPLSPLPELEFGPMVLSESPPESTRLSAADALNDYQRSVKSRSKFMEARNQLTQRGEKFEELQNRSEEVLQQAQSFNNLAKRLAKKHSAGI